MKKQKRIKYIHEGRYVAEVEIEWLKEANGWSPYLSLDDAYRLDEVRQALRRGDVKEASRQARVFVMQPVAV